MTITKLLDELEDSCYQQLGEGKDKARAAVDAEIKRMQDRIAELERQNFLMEEDIMKYDMALIRKLTSETPPVSDIT